jgi:uncharacterized protein
MIQRALSTRLKAIYKYFPVISLNGPRQSGKSTLLKNTFPKLPYTSLENPDTIRLALNDPRGFLDNFPNGAIIDEAQHAPELFSYIQGIVDDNPKIKFILSGSQNFLLTQQITQTLAGRVGVLTLLPFSANELMMANKFKTKFEDVAFTGFFPRIYDKKIPPALFYPSYLQTYVQRDILQISKIADSAQFLNFLKLLAGRVGQLLNLSSIANDVGVAVNTIKSWIHILEMSYIIYLLRPHHNNFSKRLIQMPKIYFIDTGLLCYLLEIEKPSQIKTHFCKGGIFENYTIIELLKSKYNAATLPKLSFWRDKVGHEVDVILESGNHLVPIEIKSSQTKSLHFFDGLKYYKNLAKAKSKNGFVVYGGKDGIITSDGEILPWNKLDNILKL